MTQNKQWFVRPINWNIFCSVRSICVWYAWNCVPSAWDFPLIFSSLHSFNDMSIYQKSKWFVEFFFENISFNIFAISLIFWILFQFQASKGHWHKLNWMPSSFKNSIFIYVICSILWLKDLLFEKYIQAHKLSILIQFYDVFKHGHCKRICSTPELISINKYDIFNGRSVFQSKQ